EVARQRGAGVGWQRARQRTRLLEPTDRVAVGEGPGGVLRRQDEVANRSMMIAPLLEVPCQLTGNRGGPRAVGTLEPFADPLMQSHAPTARHSFGDGGGIQAVGEAVTRDLRAVGSYER